MSINDALHSQEQEKFLYVKCREIIQKENEKISFDNEESNSGIKRIVNKRFARCLR